MRCIAQYGKFGVQYRPRKANVDINSVETVTPVSYTHLTLPTNREV